MFGAIRDGELAAADWGVTATPAAASVEVALHARRTLASVAGARVAGSALTVDVGGLFVELNASGAVRAPGDLRFPMDATGVLPGVTVPGFRLTGGGVDARPELDTVVVRSAPANVTIRLGALGPVWTYVGELAAAQTTPDFADALRTFLVDADVRDGAYVIPFAVHADGVTRLDLALELEYLLGQSFCPEGWRMRCCPSTSTPLRARAAPSCPSSCRRARRSSRGSRGLASAGRSTRRGSR